MNLEKAYDTINQHGMWPIRVADAKSVWSSRKIVESGAEFLYSSRACVRVGMDVSE